MSSEGVRLARDALADIELVAQLRSAFAEAQTIMGQTLAGFGLTEQRYHLLLVAAAGDVGGTVQGALARELHCPESRISLLVHELSDARLVDTLRDETDRRQVRVRVTGEGEAILGRAICLQRESLRNLISQLDVDEVTRLAELVARMYLGLELTVSMKVPLPPPAPPGRNGRARSAPAKSPAPIATVAR